MMMSLLQTQILSDSSESSKVKSIIQGLISEDQELVINVVYEKFGFFVSSEGAPLALKKLKEEYTALAKRPIRILTSCAGTFFCPSCVTVEEAYKGGDLYLTPKLALVKALNITAVSLTSERRYLEWYDFNGSTTSISLRQNYEHKFKVIKEGQLNSLSCFIYIDCGDGPPPKRNLKEPNGCKTFPFGDNRLYSTPNHLAFSSDSDTSNPDSHGQTHWKNPVIILPNVIHVVPGDHIIVKTQAVADSSRPHYSFFASVQKETGTLIDVGRVDLDFDDVYPSFKEVPELQKKAVSNRRAKRKQKDIGEAVKQGKAKYPCKVPGCTDQKALKCNQINVSNKHMTEKHSLTKDITQYLYKPAHPTRNSKRKKRKVEEVEEEEEEEEEDEEEEEEEEDDVDTSESDENFSELDLSEDSTEKDSDDAEKEDNGGRIRTSVPVISAYELKRQATIAANKAKMKELGLLRQPPQML
jgi:hypothetical protein